ncbi:MAG: 30S ribosomal protein S12 methylthiotransferase RimO [Candidatus Kapabacteria bacterium]|nr:30S ribosomal protein S12 methylthiotransferase RimO [Candidatus Kapabacteria bacterium]
MTKSVHIITLGCSKNTVDSETLAGHLSVNDFTLAADIESADTVIINTCGFIDAAKEESVNTILEAAKLKASGSIETLVVAGCLSERYGDELKAEIPEVDHFFGTEAYEPILKALSSDLKYSLLGERIRSTPSHFAYMKISEGCDHPCSFCAIPIMRGNHRSTPIETLVQQAQALVRSGTKELVLVAQDLTYYGQDIYGKQALADLLGALSDDSGATWIRLMYAYPAKFPLNILPLIRDRANICTYLDMPLQHASTDVLKSMRRGITGRATEELLSTIRDTVPDITLRSTFIVGYPNESASDFDQLMHFLDRQKLDRVGVFTYSQEDDTYASILGDPIPTDIKEERKLAVMELQRGISLTKNLAKIGTTQRVLVEEEFQGEYRCRSEADAPEVDNEVWIRSSRALAPGTFLDVTIEDAAEFDLFATLS